MSAPEKFSLDKLNPAQREAAKYLDGPCLVLAGAGSGKTRVITQKIAYLIGECGHQARHVLALTFTNKAAREMQERIKPLLPRQMLKGLTISTFHSLGLRFLREESQAAGLKARFSILDADDAVAIIQDALATTDRGRLKAVQQRISLWKNALVSPDQAGHLAATPDEVEAAHVYRGYEATLRAYQSVDFDDLVALPVYILQRDEALRMRWRNRIRHLLVDEYQDTNACQYRLLQLLVEGRERFTAVGDDDQAIYAWRGATVQNLARLTDDYPSLRIIKLEQNYRSVQRVLNAANSVIDKNPKLFEKKLWSELGVGEPIVVSPMDNEQTEAESVGMKISAARFERRATWKDFAVLYRSNHQAMVIEQALRNLRIPYTVSGGQSFFDKAEIRDILSYLRLIANEDDDPAFIRAATTPRRGIGQATLQTLGQYAAQRGVSLHTACFEMGAESLLAARQWEPLHTFAEFIQRISKRADMPQSSGAAAGELLDEVLGAIQYERYLYDTMEERPAQSRWQNVLELVNWLKRKAQEDNLTLADLSQHVALVTMLERGEDDEPDAVKLSTLHAAKGLEYPHVYLIGVEEGLLPHQGKDDEQGDSAKQAESVQARIEEERRLMYVGITRAQRTLNVSWCKKRRRAREDMIREPSRFIEEMGLDDPQASGEDAATAAMNPRQRLDMLKALLNKP